jgi:hypothetical protein
MEPKLAGHCTHTCITHVSHLGGVAQVWVCPQGQQGADQWLAVEHNRLMHGRATGNKVPVVQACSTSNQDAERIVVSNSRGTRS